MLIYNVLSVLISRKPFPSPGIKNSLTNKQKRHTELGNKVPTNTYWIRTLSMPTLNLDYHAVWHNDQHNPWLVVGCLFGGGGKSIKMKVNVVSYLWQTVWSIQEKWVEQVKMLIFLCDAEFELWYFYLKYYHVLTDFSLSLLLYFLASYSEEKIPSSVYTELPYDNNPSFG